MRTEVDMCEGTPTAEQQKQWFEQWVRDWWREMEHSHALYLNKLRHIEVSAAYLWTVCCLSKARVFDMLMCVGAAARRGGNDMEATRTRGLSSLP